MALINSGVLNEDEFLNFMETQEEVKIEYYDNGNKMSEEFFKDDMKIDNVSVSDIALTYGTPCFLYSEDAIIKNYSAISNSKI